MMFVNNPTEPEMTNKLSFPFTFICICMYAYAMGNIKWSEGILQELTTLSFLGLGDETEVTRFGGKWFYSLSHLTSQILLRVD